MSLSALVTAALLGQAALAGMATPGTTGPQTVDVAYQEIAAGQPQAALHKLEGSSDPAALINLGAAYAQAGMTDKAFAAYRAAIASPERYDLELADGTWADSRDAARQALRNLRAANVMAVR